MIRTLSIFASVSFLGLAWSAGAADFGRTPGSFGVSPSGAATYSIPIWTPPGPNGVTPGISLSYSSLGGNGLGGVGWNLGAVSSIERCRRTKHQDGSSGEVSLTSVDRYCIGGNRLRLDSGTYGASGSVYFTEIADYSRITAHGTAGNGPQYFIVEAKNGLKYEYGNTTSSRVVLGTTVLRWMLSKVYDRNGNNYVVSYNNATGFAVPDVISWAPTSLGAGTYRYEAKFNYSTSRTDKDSYIGKVATYDVANRNRLESIQIKSSGNVVRKYRFAYDSSAVTFRSRLTSAKECADDSETNCFLPITFAYQPGQFGVTVGAGTPPAGSSNGLVAGRYDFNGDGKDDIAYLSGGICHAAFGANTGFSGPYSIGTTTCGVIDRFMPNGRDAVAVMSGGNRWIYKWDDATSVFVGVNTGTGGAETVAADYDGDGLADFISYTGNQLWVRRNTSTAASSNPTFGSSALAATLPASAFGGTPQFSGLKSYFGSGLQRADLNGDGRQEIFADITVNFLMGATPYSAVLQASSTGYVIPATGTWTSPTPTFSIDFNGDSCTDRILSTTVYISHCSGVAATTLAAPAFPSLILDWDGDGKSDILAASGGTFVAYLSTGTGFSSAFSTPIPSGGLLYALDQDGDRQEDVIRTNGTAAISYWTHTAGGYVPTPFATNIPDLLSSATDGFGINFSPGYVSTGTGSYEKGVAPALPLQETDPRIVVAQTTQSNGIGGTFSKTYHYVGLREQAERDQVVGFQRVDETDSRSGLIMRTYFNQLFPVGGMVSQRELMQSDGVTPIRRTVYANTYAVLDSTANNQRYFAYPSGSTATEYEFGGGWNGALLRTTTTANLFESTGGALYDQTVTTTEPASGANGAAAGGSWTSRTYFPTGTLLNDTTNWCVGRPKEVLQVNSTNLTYGSAATRTTSIAWNASNCRQSQVVTEPGSPTLQVTTDIGYDSFGNVNSTTVTGIGMTPRTTSVVYADATYTTGQFPLSVTNALSQTSTAVWNYDLGVPSSAADANGVSTSWQYDPFGRRNRENRADGTATTWSYNHCMVISGYCLTPEHKTIVIETALDSASAYVNDVWTYFDQFDRLITTTTRTMEGSYNRVATEYNALGQVYRQNSPCLWTGCTFYWTTNAYDSIGRLTSTTRPISESNSTLQSTNIYYKGLTTEVVDALSNSSTSMVNAAGQLVRSMSANSYYQSFEYDPFGNVKRVQDSLGNALQSSDYDLRGALKQRTDMDMGSWTFTPNALGETVSQTDAKSQTTTFVFDELGRLKSRIEAEGTSTWTWGTSSAAKNIGRLASVSGPGYSESYTYDSLGRPSTTSISADTTYQIDYGYNSLGLLDTLTYPTSTSSYRLKLKHEYQYGQLNRIRECATSACTTFGVNYWTGETVDASNRLTQELLGNTLLPRRGYDAVTGWLSWIYTGPGGGGSVQYLRYEWDLVGNLKKRKDVNQSDLTEEFFYDNVNRLDYSTLNGVTNLNMDYDQLGNITSKSDVGTYTYHPSKKHQVTSTSNGWSYGYDNNGNMDSGRGSTIDWTSYNYARCIRKGVGCSGTGTDWSSFSYTPDRQYWKQESNYVSGGTATTIYVGGLLEKVTAGGVTDYRHMIRAGNSTVIVSRKSSGANTVNYVTQDHLGSSSAITNSSGGILVNSSFDAYGKRRGGNWSGNPSSGDWTAIASMTRRGYTDHSMLDNVGLIHMSGRVQDPVIGRFVSADRFIADPLNTQNYNRYSYLDNNPLSFIDPSGFKKVTIRVGYCMPYGHGRGGPVKSTGWGFGIGVSSEGVWSSYSVGSSATPVPSFMCDYVDVEIDIPDDAELPANAIQTKSRDATAPADVIESESESIAGWLGTNLEGLVGLAAKAFYQEPPPMTCTPGPVSSCSWGPNSPETTSFGGSRPTMTKGAGGAVEGVYPEQWLVGGGARGFATAGKNAAARAIPNKVADTLKTIQRTGAPPPGYVGGRVFKNAEGQLPAGGRYREYDVDPAPGAGGRRNAERLVIDENTGKAWYTDDHYGSFREIGP